jgi:hypothetical protein
MASEGVTQAIRRWLSELGNPGAKCARVGHDLRDHRRRIYLYPSDSWLSSRYVADVASEAWRECRRCGKREEPQIINRRGLTGLSLPAHKWDTLRETGRVEANDQ